MDQETWKKLKRGSPQVIKKQLDKELPTAWFLSYHITQDVALAATVLQRAWIETLKMIMDEKGPPKESFLTLFSMKVGQLTQDDILPENEFEELKPPQVASKFRVFTKQLPTLPDTERIIYLLYTFGGVSFEKISGILHIKPQKIKEQIETASSTIMKQARADNHINNASLITLSAEFRCVDKRGTNQVQVPDFLRTSIEHHLMQIYEINITTGRKETPHMEQKRNRKKAARIRKIIITSAVICILAVGGGFGIWKLASSNAVTSEITTTYYAEAITYGNVDTTISGSGTLTPVTNKTFSCENPCTVNTLNVAVGDTVSEGDVLAVVTQQVTETVMDEETMQMTEETTEEKLEITADFDGTITELNVSEGDTLAAGEEIAILMGNDGFTLDLSVDETEIANLSIGQTVTMTVDAVKGEYEGEVTNVSYNGKTSGSTTYYAVTAEIESQEGIYAGMSASAEIVVESSGDGLLVPVAAVHTSGDDSYVLLAPNDAESGTEYAEDAITLDNLTRVTVDTGMSDGSYIMIESDELAEGDLILMSEVSTTATGSDSEDGGFGGNMDFGDIDFSNFDPNNMPQGGMPGGRQ